MAEDTLSLFDSYERSAWNDQLDTLQVLRQRCDQMPPSDLITLLKTHATALIKGSVRHTVKIELAEILTYCVTVLAEDCSAVVDAYVTQVLPWLTVENTHLRSATSRCIQILATSVERAGLSTQSSELIKAFIEQHLKGGTEELILLVVFDCIKLLYTSEAPNGGTLFWQNVTDCLESIADSGDLPETILKQAGQCRENVMSAMNKSSGSQPLSPRNPLQVITNTTSAAVNSHKKSDGPLAVDIQNKENVSPNLMLSDSAVAKDAAAPKLAEASGVTGKETSLKVSKGSVTVDQDAPGQLFSSGEGMEVDAANGVQNNTPGRNFQVASDVSPGAGLDAFSSNKQPRDPTRDSTASIATLELSKDFILPKDLYNTNLDNAPPFTTPRLSTSSIQSRNSPPSTLDRTNSYSSPGTSHMKLSKPSPTQSCSTLDRTNLYSSPAGPGLTNSTMASSPNGTTMSTSMDVMPLPQSPHFDLVEIPGDDPAEVPLESMDAEYRQLYAQYLELNNQFNELRAQHDALKVNHAELQKRNEKRKATLEGLLSNQSWYEAKTEELQLEIKEQQQRYEKLHNHASEKLKLATGEINSRNQALRTLKNEIVLAQQELEATSTQLQNAKEHIQSKERKIEQLTQKSAAAKEDLQRCQHELSQCQAQLAEVNAKFQEAVQQLNQGERSLESFKKEAVSRERTLQAEIVLMKAKIQERDATLEAFEVKMESHHQGIVSEKEASKKKLLSILLCGGEEPPADQVDTIEKCMERLANLFKRKDQERQELIGYCQQLLDRKERVAVQ